MSFEVCPQFLDSHELKKVASQFGEVATSIAFKLGDSGDCFEESNQQKSPKDCLDTNFNKLNIEGNETDSENLQKGLELLSRIWKHNEIIEPWVKSRDDLASIDTSKLNTAGCEE